MVIVNVNEQYPQKTEITRLHFRNVKYKYAEKGKEKDTSVRRSG